MREAVPSRMAQSWLWNSQHCRKSVQIRSFLFRIQFKCRKIRTRKNSVFGHFSRSANYWFKNPRKMTSVTNFSRALLVHVLTSHLPSTKTWKLPPVGSSLLLKSLFFTYFIPNWLDNNSNTTYWSNQNQIQ